MKENVTASVTAIKAELDALAKEGYFLAIVRSEDPNPDTFKVEGEDELEGENEVEGEDKLRGEDERRIRRKRRGD